MPGYSTYLRQLLIAIAIPLLMLAGFNLLLDPYGEFNLLRRTTLPQHAAALGSRIGKGEALDHRDWNLLLLGNSRVQMGLDPRHPAFDHLRVYNAGLYGADFAEINRAARMAMRHPSLKRIILCLDLFSFDPTSKPVPDVRQSLLNSDINPIDYRLANLLSANATAQSIGTMDNILHHRDGDHWPLGLFVDPGQIKRHGHADWVLGGFYQLTVPRVLRKSPSFQLNDRAFAALGTLLDDAGRNGVRIDVVQLPMHVMSLQRYATEHRWNVYEQWLTRLTETIDAHNRRQPTNPVRFWDFCEYTPLTTEPFPGPAQTITNMKWYWDPFHFKKELGDLVIDRVMDIPAPPGVDVAGFGEIITASNLLAHLEKLRAARDLYYASHAGVRDIEAQVRTARASGTDDDD